METKLKPKTTPVKEVTKSSPSTNSRTANVGASRARSSDTLGKFMPPSPLGMRIAKIRNR